MKTKLPYTEDTEQQYFDDLLAKIREIRKSKRSPQLKISDIVSLTIDKHLEEANKALAELFAFPAKMSEEECVRMANFLVFTAEGCALCKNTITVEFLANQVKRELSTIKSKNGIYDFPSFNAVYKDDEDEEKEDDDEYYMPETKVCLPKELEGFKGRSMILKIEDMDRLVDTFCSRNTYYRRAYAILADLDKEVLESLENGAFPQWTDVEYKDGGWANFEFSHFEADLREPDSQFRTLYVVYRYDTTAS